MGALNDPQDPLPTRTPLPIRAVVAKGMERPLHLRHCLKLLLRPQPRPRHPRVTVTLKKVGVRKKK
jgi:hypothetical protein